MEQQEKVLQLAKLISYLNARTAEYDAGHPTISDKEWDDKYFELVQLENELQFTFPSSPTQQVYFETVSELEKVEHTHKMLSLDKTKDIDDIIKFLGDKPFLAMCKMDGLTCSLRYENGRLVKAETRGNGIVGENILHNARVIPSIPNSIPTKDTIEIDGEIICTFEDFSDFSDDYKNPRNFAAGSIRLLDANECAQRKLTFVAWDVITGFDDYNLLSEKLDKIRNWGFIVVPYITANIESIRDIPHILFSISQNEGFPIDGVVFKFDDIAYGKSLGETAHHFKNAIAYKFYDFTYETTLEDIEWSMGRTGILTPVAIFTPTEIEGTQVSRASLHNISVMEAILGDSPYKGQKISVFKANMIIPQVADADKDFNENIKEENIIHIPEVCPICGEPIVITNNNNIKFMLCTNNECPGKLINRLEHFCGKKGLDIKGLSRATLDKLIGWGWLYTLSDIFNLKNYRNEWIKKDGFGEKSVDKILDSIEASKHTTLEAFISSLGIPLIGRNVSKELAKRISTYEEFREKINNRFNFASYAGFAESKTHSLWHYDYTDADNVYPYLSIDYTVAPTASVLTCQNSTFVITGTLSHFKNRTELKDFIEEHGGKVLNAISSKVNYLINNNVNSTSTKNKEAKKLNIPIISEDKFLELFSERN